MPGIHIVTDSGSDIAPKLAQELGVTVVPLTIRFGETEYRDGVDLGVEEFYSKMAEMDGLPATAAPSPGAFAEAFAAAADAGATGVVCINLAANLSATIEAARNAAADLADRIEVRVVDSKTVTGGLQSLVVRARDAAEAGASLDEIEQMVTERADRTRIFGTFDTLENLKMGGRIGGAQAFLGTLLSIKPIIEVVDGQVTEAGKQRTRRKALEWIRTRVETLGDVEDLTILEAMAPDAETFRDMFSDPDAVKVIRLGATIGTHGGPRSMGVSYVLPPTGV